LTDGMHRERLDTQEMARLVADRGYYVTPLAIPLTAKTVTAMIALGTTAFAIATAVFWTRIEAERERAKLNTLTEKVASVADESRAEHQRLHRGIERIEDLLTRKRR
jgi:hypothetical protein